MQVSSVSQSEIVDGRFVNSNYSTAILKCPTPEPRYRLVGAVPMQLGESWWTRESDAINDLLGVGITRFQMADCSWFDAAVCANVPNCICSSCHIEREQDEEIARLDSMNENDWYGEDA